MSMNTRPPLDDVELAAIRSAGENFNLATSHDVENGLILS